MGERHGHAVLEKGAASLDSSVSLLTHFPLPRPAASQIVGAASRTLGQVLSPKNALSPFRWRLQAKMGSTGERERRLVGVSRSLLQESLRHPACSTPLSCSEPSSG